MANNKKGKGLILDQEISDLYLKHKNASFDTFFELCIEDVLKKNQSIYDLIHYCYNAGYWNAMRETVSDKELRSIAKKIVEEIDKQ